MMSAPLDPSVSPADRPSLPARLLNPKVAIPLIFLLVLVVTPFIFRATRIAGIPDIGDPFDRTAFGTVSIPPGENAYDDYLAATKLLTPLTGAKDEDLATAVDHGWEHASEGIGKWVEANRPALSRWKAGTEKTDAVYIQPKDLTIDVLLPAIQELRNLGRLSRIEASRLQQEGELPQAWELHRALFRCSRHVGMHGCAIESLVGTALHGLAVAGIERWSEDPRITPELLKQAIEQLQDDDRLTAPLSTTLKTEYLFVINTLEGDSLLSAMGTGGAVQSLGNVGLFLINEPNVSRLVFQQIFANYLEECDKPRSARRPQAAGSLVLFEPDPSKPLPPGRLTPPQIEKAIRKAPLAALFAPAMSTFDDARTKERARQQSLITMLSAKIYRSQHGQWPADLKILVEEELLTSLPEDPFSPKAEPMRYKVSGEEVLIWSLGANGVDDGGIVDNKSHSSTPTDIGLRVPFYREPIPEKESTEPEPQ